MRTLHSFIFFGLLFANAKATETPAADSATVSLANMRFVPPPPPAPAPAMRVNASTRAHFGTHRIEVLLGAASTLPDLPPPPVQTAPASERELRPAKLRYLVSLAVTVYDQQVSHLKWQHPITKEHFEVWWACDASLITSIPLIETPTADLMLACLPRVIDTTRQSRLGKPTSIPHHPELAQDHYQFTIGKPTEPGGEEIMKSLSGYYLKHQETLRELRLAQKAYQADERAWREANPTKPENHTIWLKPHRGSRYLLEAEPAGGR
jgi:hypothetical protein